VKTDIRPMTAADKPAVMNTLRALPEFTPEEVVVAEEVIDSYLEKSLGSGYHILVAEAASSVMGYVCYGPTPMTEGTWDMYWLAVDAGRQGQGIGRALMAFAEEKVRENDGRLIIIETSGRPQYDKTRRFHESQGYTEVGRIADFYSPGDDKLFFEKRFT
jgi:ribosomal protein S18 acetylase RimI-like enzyme